MLKYQTALDENDKVIDISTLKSSDRKTLGAFRCIGCRGDMVAALGNIREHHFKHKSKTNCSFETYLHKAAKLAVSTGLKKAVKENGEYWVFVKQSVNCPQKYRKGACGNCGQRKAKVNLAKIVDTISLEKKAHGFIADVLTENSLQNLQIAIEICVTNPCSSEKITSGLSIIETKVTNEADVQKLYKGIPDTSVDYNVPHIQTSTADKCLLLLNESLRSPKESEQKSEITYKRSLILYDDGRLFILNQPFTNAFRDEVEGQYFDYCIQKNHSGHKTRRTVLGVWGVTKAFVDEEMVGKAIAKFGRQKIKSCVGCKQFSKYGPNVLENITCKRRGAKPQHETLQCDLFDPK